MSQAHKGQILPLVNQMIPIDKQTTFHASYDYHLNGYNQGTLVTPLMPIRALHFDGANGTQIDIPNISFSATDSWSAECWVYCETPSSQWIFLLGDDTSTNKAIVISPTNNQLGFRADDSSYLYGPALVRTQWNHICMTYNNGNIVFYLNGVDSGAVVKSSTMVFNNIGWAYTNYSSVPAFTGSVSELRIWNRALLSNEVQANMNRILTDNEPGLAGYWKLNEQEGKVAHDYSPNQNDGIYSGGITPTNGPIIATLKKREDKFGGAVLIEPATTNLYANPSLQNLTGWSTGDWSSEGGAVRIVYDNILKRNVAELYKASDGSNATISNTVLFQLFTWPSAFTSSRTFTLSCDALNLGAEINLSIQALDSNGANTYYRTYTMTHPANQWTRVSQTFILPANTIKAYVLMRDDMGYNKYIRVANAQFEEIPYATSFIDGSRPSGLLKYPIDIINEDEGTIAMWVYAPSGNNTLVYPSPLYSSGVDSAYGTFDFLIGNNINPYIRVYSSSGTTTQIRPTKFEYDKWKHVIVTWKKGALFNCYIDGEYDIGWNSPVDWTGWKSKATGFYLGSGTGYNSIVMIDELRIESRAISSDEAAAWAASGIHYNYLDYSDYVD